jgi:glycosyltransferase involved in cell wall biosynthesis
MPRKRILIFSLAYYPQVGGAEIAIKEITDRISDIEFHLVTMRFSNVDAKEEKIGNIIVHRIGSHRSYLSKIFFVFRAAGFAKRLHVQQKFDAAWAMMSYMLVPVALLRLGGTKLPYVLTLQEGDTYKHMFGRLRVWPLLPFISYGFRHATVVQTISTHLSAWARKRGYHGPLEVIPNGVDVQKFTGDKLPHQRMVLITASRLVPKNGLDVVVRALKDLPNLQFKIFGTGPEENKLRSLAHKVGVENRVDFEGYVDHRQLPNVLRAADIFIRPSRSEGMGNSFIEAMAAGLPVIATQEGGIADFLFDAKRNPGKPTTGWAVDKDNPHQIVQAVHEILSNPEQANKVIEQARGLVNRSYDWDLIATQMQEKVFNRLFKIALQ